MGDAVNDFIENVCDDLQDALTDLFYNDDNDEEYERVRSLIRLISTKTDSWAKENVDNHEKEQQTFDR